MFYLCIRITKETSAIFVFFNFTRHHLPEKVGDDFFNIYLRSTTFCKRLFARTKQLRPSLYLPVAATTSGG